MERSAEKASEHHQTGIHSPSYVIACTDIFAKRVRWWEENYLSRQKPEVIKSWIGRGSERMIRRHAHLRPLYRVFLASIPSLVGNKIDAVDRLTPVFSAQKVA